MTWWSSVGHQCEATTGTSGDVTGEMPAKELWNTQLVYQVRFLLITTAVLFASPQLMVKQKITLVFLLF